jgi:hypothetical protein
MKQGYRFKTDKCPRCGKPVKENWVVRHMRSKCKTGIVAAANKGIKKYKEGMGE